MSVGINRYKADLRELQFVLFEQFGFDQIAGKGPYEGWDADTAKSILQETYRFAREVLGPLNGSADREGCKVVDGSVITPKGFKDAWKQLFEAGLKQIAVPKEFGGQGAPYALYALIEELTSGANTAFNAPWWRMTFHRCVSSTNNLPSSAPMAVVANSLSPLSANSGFRRALLGHHFANCCVTSKTRTGWRRRGATR